MYNANIEDDTNHHIRYSIRELSLDKSKSDTDSSIVIHHFAGKSNGPKIYIQAGIHGNEHPGSLVAAKLIDKLKQFAVHGNLRGSVTILPIANPIVFSQVQYGETIGRFDRRTGCNFNRSFPDFTKEIVTFLTANRTAPLDEIRAALLSFVDLVDPADNAEQMKLLLIRLACQNDIVLDFHADSESLLHLYSPTGHKKLTEMLSASINSDLVLLGTSSENRGFDDTINGLWQTIADNSNVIDSQNSPAAFTIEYRGRHDTDDELLDADATNLFEFIMNVGSRRRPSKTRRKSSVVSMPIRGLDICTSPKAGYLKFHRPLGGYVKEGEIIAEILGPELDDRASTTLAAKTDGILFCRSHLSIVPVGQTLFKIAGEKSLVTDDSALFEP